MKKLIKSILLTFTMFWVFPQAANATYVGEVQTTKYLDPTTVALISSRLQSGNPGIQVGDEVSYFIQFTPTNNGGMVGAGGYVTDYIPAGTQVVNAQFVQLNADGSFTQISPPSPAAMLRMYVPIYTETGIFYSTDPRTAKYTNPNSTNLTSANGYPLGAATGCVAASLPSTTHNAWDNGMMLAYESSVMGRAGQAPNAGCATLTMATLLVGAPTASIVGSAVAGPDALIKTDYTGGQGPWRRISYPGSMMGTLVGTPLATNANACVGGQPTSAGASFPLPANTNAVRFAAGRVTVGELFTVRITLKVTQPVGVSGIINNSEVFGGDASLDPGSVSGRHVPWRYHCPAVANADTTLTVLKTVVGMCTGAGCVIQPFSGGAIPSIANVKLRYRITYLNSSGGTHTGVVLSDILPAGGAYVANSATVVSGPNILPITPAAPAAGSTFSFSPIASLGSGGGGTVELDVNFATAPANNSAIKNTAKLTSVSVPAGVQSVASVTATNVANLAVNKITTTPARAPGATATYKISIANNGAGAATGITVRDYLPSTGSTGGLQITDRFQYVTQATGTSCVGGATTITLAAGQACGVFTSSAGVVQPVALTVTSGTVANVAPYIGQNRELVTFTMPAAPAFASGSNLDITFNALVGSNIAASSTPYTNDTIVQYGGGFATAPALSSANVVGVAPVTVTSDLSMALSIDCVYTGVTCVAYTGGTIPTASKVRYRLDYSNTGGAQTGVTLDNTMPANTTYVAASVVGGTLAGQTGQTLNFDIPDIAAGSPSTPTTGFMTFEVQLGSAALIPSGSYITNAANLASDQSPGGVSVSMTTSVLDSANLSISHATLTPTIAAGGTVTYTVTVTNTGNTNASNIVVYDELPYSGATANALTRFNYSAGSAVVTCLVAPCPATAPTVTAVVAPTMAGYTTFPNQQEVAFNFGAQTLAPGSSFKITYTAAAGTGIAAGSAAYQSDVIAKYSSGATVLYASDLNTASVTIPTGLSVSTSIDCVYNTAGTLCEAYSGSGIIPLNSTVRYKMHYQNTAATAQTNVYLCNQITSTQAAPALTANITTPVTTARSPAGASTNTAAPNGPPVGAVTNPAVAACGFAATGVRFNYPVIPTLAAGASGDVYFDAVTNVAVGATLTNTSNITLSAAPGTAPSASETASVNAFVQDGAVITITKATSTPAVKAGNTATYTITLKNTGNVATTSLKVYDFLPFAGTTADPTTRFQWLANGAISCAPAAPCPALPAAVTQITPASNNAPFDANTNQQQVSWDFGALALAPGASISFTFDAAVGSAIPADDYFNNVKADITYGAAPNAKSASYRNPLGDASDMVTAAANLADIVVTITDGKSVVSTGDTNSYLISVTNNGADSASGIKLQFPAVAGLTKTNVTCLSANFSCPMLPTISGLEGSGLTLTPLSSGQSATFTVTTTVDGIPGTTLPATVTAVMPAGVADNTPLTPLIVTDEDEVVIPDLSTSTKTWVDVNGGTHEPGDVITYTITLYETAGMAATGVTVTDPIPANTTTLTVLSIPLGATDSSDASNLNISGIDVPANGSATVKFSVVIAAGAAVGTSITNTATVSAPSGSGASPTAAPLTVGTPPATGMKKLYLGSAVVAPLSLSRIVTPTTGTTFVQIERGSTFETWNLTPVLQAPVTLSPTISASIPVTLYLATNSVRNYSHKIDLLCGATVVSTLTTPTTALTATVTPFTFNLPLAAAFTCPAGSTWSLKMTNTRTGTGTGRNINVYPSPAAGVSNISLPSQSVINVDTLVAYDATYPAITTRATPYPSGNTVYLRATVSDPFGNFDITSANITITSPAGAALVSATAMTPVDSLAGSGTAMAGSVAATLNSAAITGTGTLFTAAMVGKAISIANQCYVIATRTSNTAITLTSPYTGQTASGLAVKTSTATACGATKAYEYAFTVPNGAAGGTWTASVTANEGTEGTVTHTRATTFDVSPSIDHYEIQVPSNSITCLPTTVTVKACQDGSNPCTATATSVTGAVTITTSNGTLSPTTFNLVSGEGTSSLTYPTATDGATATVSFVSVTDTAPNTSTCAGGAGGCSTTFNTAGFVVSATNAANAPAVNLPTQMAGKTSATYYLRAVKTGSVTRACETVLNSVTSVGVGYECTDPTTCAAADLLSVNGGTSTVVGRDDTVGMTPVSFDFTAANNAAPFTFNFADVGNIKLHFQKTGVNSANVGSGGTTLNGSSNEFLTVPYGFDVKACTTLDGLGKCGSVNASPINGSGAKFIEAGNQFKATITAVRCAEQADLSCLPGPVTPSYGTAGSVSAGSESVVLTHTLAAPTPGANGTLGGMATVAGAALNRNAFTGGSATLSDLTWSEVGVITLKADASSFMGVTLPALRYDCDSAISPTLPCSTSGNVGRFVPHHFDTLATGRMACASGLTCPASTDPMVYSGQTFASASVIAKNGFTPISGITANYKGAFAKPVTLTGVTGVTGTTAVGGGSLGGTVGALTPAAADFANGVASVAAATMTTGAPLFTLTASATPAPVDVYLNAQESTGTDLVASGGAESTQGGVKVVAGRIKVSNAYGSELLPLTIPVRLEFYDGTSWVTSTMDNVTSLNTALTSAGGNLSSAGLSVQAKVAAFNAVAGGVLQNFMLAAPGVKGKATISFASSAGNDLSYLLTNAIVTGDATFGIYTGKQPFIYLRESY